MNFGIYYDIFKSYFIGAKSSTAASVFYSIAVGAVGVVLLAAFLSAVTAGAPLSRLMPWILGFNCAHTGFMMLEKTQDRITHKKAYALTAGLLVVLLGFASLQLIFPTLVDVSAITINDLLVWFSVGVVFSIIGGVLAIQHAELSRKGGLSA